MDVVWILSRLPIAIGAGILIMCIVVPMGMLWDAAHGKGDGED